MAAPLTLRAAAATLLTGLKTSTAVRIVRLAPAAVARSSGRVRVVGIIGEDVGHAGGTMKVTQGLAERFGDLRVLDTPIAENSFVGMAVGASMKGLRPVVEGMFLGFLLLACNQISNSCGMLHCTSGGQFSAPLVTRGAGGAGHQFGPEHSLRLESLLHAVPGIKVVRAPRRTTPRASSRRPSAATTPSCCWSTFLLYDAAARVPGGEYVRAPAGAGPRQVRRGAQVTLLTYARMRHHAARAAEALVARGYDPEVVDVRSLRPFDLRTIGESVRKTGRVVIVEECARAQGRGRGEPEVGHRRQLLGLPPGPRRVPVVGGRTCRRRSPRRWRRPPSCSRHRSWLPLRKYACIRVLDSVSVAI
ncbi:hypothetical protein ACP70R_025078 [Stipagrostis hirtigluma subsp. patula]